MQLWAIEQRIIQVIQRVGEDGELSDTDAAALDALDLEKRDKALNIVRLVKHLEAETEEAARVIAGATAYIERREKRIAWLKSYLAQWCQGEKYEDAYGSLSWRKSTAVEVLDEAAIPESFCTYKPATYAPSKALLGEALKRGEDIPGARLVERDNIQIR